MTTTCSYGPCPKAWLSDGKDKPDEIQTAIIVVFSVLIALTLLYRGAKCLFAIKTAAELADFSLARLVNRADTHVSLSAGRGTPGYAAPEVWLELRMTEKCDVYSFGMLLLKILEHASNHDADAAPESSQRWFPMAAWTRYEAGELMELLVSTVHHDPRCRELAERMYKVAFWCAQQRPSARSSMSAVVKMLEGETEIAPPPNPFQHLMEPAAANLRMAMASSVNTSNDMISFSTNPWCLQLSSVLHFHPLILWKV